MPRILLPLALLGLLAACGGPAPQGISSAAPSVNVGRAALESGGTEIALQVADNLLARNPADPAALLLRADALVVANRAAEATSVYRQALAAAPGSIPAKLGLGRTLLGTDPAAAEPLFLAILDADPRHAAAANNLGIARDLQSRHAEAQIAYRRALASQPSMQAAAVNLALSLGLSGQPEQALPLLGPIARAKGAQPKIRQNYAALLALSGDRRGAAEMLAPDMGQPEVEQALGVFNALRATPGPAAVPVPALLDTAPPP